MLAVDRNAAKEFGKEGRDELKKKRDRRNLYLNEGLVIGAAAKERVRTSSYSQKKKESGRGNSDSIAECPAADLTAKTDGAPGEKEKLQNPLFFVSSVPLSWNIAGR